MKKTINISGFRLARFIRYMRIFAICLAFAVPMKSIGAEAVLCTYSSDGQVSSLMGTDFDPISNANPLSYTMGNMIKNTPVGIEIYPDENAHSHHAPGGYNSLFKYDGNPDHFRYKDITSDDYKKYYLTTNKLHEVFPYGKGRPFGWPDGGNSFYVTGANANGYICGVWFPWDLFRGRNFSLSYRFYVILADSTKLNEMYCDPVLSVGAHNACGGYSGVKTTLTNDLGESNVFAAGNGVRLDVLPGSYTKYTNSKGTFNVPNVDIGYNVTYDISFVNYNTSNFDDLLYYPYLNSYNAGHYRIVVDYINIAMEHLCVDKDSVCPGQDFNVTAIDYPLDAYLEWEYCINYDENLLVKDSKGNITKDNNNWIVYDKGPYSTKKQAKLLIPTTVNFLDKIRLRTHQTSGTYTSDVSITGGYSLPLTVTVANVEKCTPAPPEVKVHNICAPNAGLDTFRVLDPNEIADYNWTLIGPDNKDYTANFLAFDNVKDPHHTYAFVKATSAAPNGKYTLKVFGRNGLITEASSETRSFTFTIYQTPDVSIMLKDEFGNIISVGEDLCPSPLKMLKYKAYISNPAADYKYTWTNADADFLDPSKATLNVGDKADKFCSGDESSFYVSAQIDNHGCVGIASRFFTVEAPAGPFIDCNKLTIPVLNLEPTKDDIVYTFTLPSISSQCGEKPKVDVNIVGPNGAAIVATVADNKVTATYPMGTSTVTITATDDCGNSVSCVKKVTVKDVTPPNIDCSKLDNYTTRLSYYGGACLATPGEGSKPSALPVLTNPSLEDRDHPGTIIKGSFVSRSDAKDLNDPYSVGVTSIEWVFKDASGNSSTCYTTVTVIDDTEPVVNCTSTNSVIEVNTDDDLCTVSSSTLWDQVIEQMGAAPTAKLNCSSSDIKLITTVYIKSDKEDKFVVFDKNATKTYEKGDAVYTLRWSFKKESDNENVDADSSICDQLFKVVDTEQPEVTCGASSSFVITVNYKKNDPTYVYVYASGKKSDVNTQYTATSIIEDVPSATDNCGPVTMVVTVDSANAATHPILTITGTKEKIVETLRPFEFLQFTTTTITYTFTDEAGNSSECVKTISVIDRTVPVANCFTPEEVVLYADDKCQGTYDGITLEKIKEDHMATMAFTRYTTTYRYDRGPANPWGAWVIKPGANEQTTITYENEVAPSSIVRKHYSKNDKGEYELDKEDVAYAKPGLHTDFFNPGSYKIAKILVNKYEVPAGPAGMGVFPRADETTKYRLVPTVGTAADGVAGHYILVNEDEVLNTKFELGKTVLTVWYTNGDLYENGQFVEKGDSTPCEVTIIVEDTMRPKIDCGKYQNLTYKHELLTDDCTWPFDLPIPTLADLKAKDNCTPLSDLKLTYVRRFEGKDEELESEFKIGTTTLVWVVSDKNGNNSACNNKIVVEDKKGPEFDCESINPKTITAFANGDCVATYADLKDLGLVTPKSKNDACSPVGTSDSIYAEGTRSDGLGMTKPYAKVNSPITIVWSVSDAYGNVSTCDQVIVVKDTTPPSVVCDMDDLEFNIAGEACTVPASEVEAKFTKHTADDNCDGEIEGVPGTGEKGADPLLAEYPIGTTVVTWVFADKSGNAAYCPQNIIVKDSIKPDPSEICPKDPFVADAIEGTCEVKVDLPELVLHDKCDAADLLGVFKRFDDDKLTDKDPFPVGETEISWTFTDNAGNEGVCPGKVIVNDITPPVVHCNYAVNDSLLFQMTVNECGAVSSKIVEQVQIPYAYDECDDKRIDDYDSELWFYGINGTDAPVKVVDSDGNPIRWDDPDYVYQPGYTHLLFIFTDASGKSDKCDFTVIVKDNTPPSVNCDNILSPYPVYPDKDECEVTLAAVDLNELNHEKAYDHCPDADGNIQEYEGKPYNPYTDKPFEIDHSLVLKAGEKVTIWWKYVSPKGGTALCVQDIMAIDTQKFDPHCERILDIEATAEAEKCFIQGAKIAEQLKPYPVVDDNCGPIEGVPSRMDGKEIDDDYPTGTTTIVWTFSDSNPENTATCEQKVFVRGSIPPEIKCDTFRTFFDTIPDCETRPLAIRTPYAIDVCAPDSIGNKVPGVPTRSDGKTIDAPFPLGNTIVKWTFTDFTGSVSSSCSDTVNVRTQEKMVISCVDDVKPDMEEGECDYQVTVPVATAKHPCLDVTFPGTPYIKGSTKPLPVVDGKLDYKFHVGSYTVLWVFVDSTTNSLVKSVDTCSTAIQIGNKNQMPVDCDNYPAIRKALTGNCSIDAAELGFSDPEVVDLCTGKTIIPYIYRVLRDKPTDTLSANQLGEFVVGEQDTIVRVFSFKSEGQTEGSVLECRQPVWILDSLNIKTNCLPDDSITTLMAEDGKCTLNMEAVLDSLGTPEATDKCLDHPIPGKPYIYKDGVLSTIKKDDVIEVGKVTVIRWIFSDPLANADSAYCDQKVTAKSNLLPVGMNCDSLKNEELTFVAKGSCEYEFTEADFTAPMATDPCTGIQYPGKGHFKSNNASIVGAKLKVGYDTVVWVFSTPTTIAVDSCVQPIVVKSDNKPEVTCSDKVLDTTAANGECEIPLETLMKLLEPYPVATEYCTKTPITGVPTYNGSTTLPSSLRVGDTITITWVFTDDRFTTDTAYCDQKVTANGTAAPIFDCSTLDTLPFIAKGECFVNLTEADIPTPIAVDSCTSEEVKGVGVRANGTPIVGSYYVGYDTIVWTFTSPHSTVSKSCEQIVYVRSDNQPKVDCDKMPDTTLLADGECEIPLDKVLEELGDPVGREFCTDSIIHGVPTLENGDPLPAAFPVGKTITIRWTFAMPEFTTAIATCEQAVTVNGNSIPKFDCSTLDTLPFVAKGECTVDLEPADIPVPEAKDGCDDDALPIPGVPSRKDGGDVYGTYPVGGTVITWTFKSNSSSEIKTCDQVVWVKTDKELNAECGEEKYPNIPFVVENGDCAIDPDAVFAQLSNHEVFNPCNVNIKAVVDTSRSDGKPMNAPYEIGVTTITWTFTDTTNTLVNPVSSCDQTVTVTDHNDPVIECPVSFPAVKIYLDEDNCTADFAQIPVLLDTIPYNPCSHELAEVDTTRLSGLSIHEPFEKGVDTIKWYFRFPSTGRDAYCLQRVEVIDTIAPDFDCDVLKDTIKVELTTSGESVTYDDVVAAGFYVPVVTDKCSEITTTVERDDNADYKDPYFIGKTKVTFTFTDDQGNLKTCSQIVEVVDLIPPTVDCPSLNKALTCISDTTPAYQTFEEFKLAGGVVSDEKRIDPASFRHTDVVDGDDCNATITRNYFFTTIRGGVVECTVPQVFNVNDNVAPTYVGVPKDSLTRVTTCSALDIAAPVITAVDNCDPEPVVKFDSISTQDPDPTKCEHYNYEIRYSWVATDRCGNVADSVKFKVYVRDTAAPHVNVPASWYVETHPVYGGDCQFYAPNIEDLIPRDSITLDCGDSRYVKFRQEPPAGQEVTESINMKLYITTVCGNDTVLTKFLHVQPRKEIVQVVTDTVTLVCGDDVAWLDVMNAKNSLSNAKVRRSSGKVYVEEYGEWVPVPSTPVWYYYRGDTISESTLLFSTDRNKYGERFGDAFVPDGATDAQRAHADSVYGSYNLLLRRTQSDNYIFVIADTVTGCLDTAYTYIDVRERPRLALESGEWDICSGDSLTLQGDFGDRFPVCVVDMGAPIEKEGWMVNDSVYKPLDSVFYDNGALHTGVYYATNECGTTTSLSSLYVSCDGTLETTEDSLKLAGSPANLELLRKELFTTSDSVKINVYTQYDPAQILLRTYPQDKPRIFEGEEAELYVQLPYDNATIYKWMQVVGEYDARGNAIYNRYGEVVKGGSMENDDQEFDTYYDPTDTTHARYVNRATVLPNDSSLYYVVVGNGVCPTVSSNVVAIDVLHQLPTAITPYTKDGLNDVFMPRHHVVIFNRYGQMIFEGRNGWDGTYRGLLADPGVYFYEVEIGKNGVTVKGSIEVVKFE